MRIWGWLLGTLILVVLAGCGGGGNDAPRSIPTAAIQGVLDSSVSDTAPGLLCAVCTPVGTWSSAAGKAEVATNTSMSGDMQVRIGSLTKQFVAAVILQLRDEGKLALTDSIEHWLPGTVPNGSQITLTMLLNHTSGLFDYITDETFEAQLLSNPARLWTPQELLQIAFAHPAVSAPGTQYAYCNTNYLLLGLVIEAATGHTAAEELQTRLFTPLGLTHTRLASTPELDEPFAHGYLNSAGTPFTDITGLSPTCAWTAGAIVSTGEDLLKWTDALFNGQVLSANSLHEMLTPVPPATDYGYGMSMMTNIYLGEKAYLHVGGIPGYSTALIYLTKSHITLFTAMNVYPGSEEVLEDATTSIVALLLNKPLPTGLRVLPTTPSRSNRAVPLL